MLTTLKKLLPLGLLISQLQSFAQVAPPFEREQWSASTTVQKPGDKYSTESAIILLDKRQIEFIDEKEEVVAYKTLHRRIHITDDKGIEQFNRVYLPVSSNSEIVDIMARTILPNGKIITVDSKNIRDLKEDDQNYKIFAMEGLEKGCDVEFYYTYKANVSFFGREVIQHGYPVVEAQVAVIYPERLTFEMKGYNQVNAAVDTIMKAKRVTYVRQQEIPGVDREKYAAYESNLKRVEYKLSYNAARGKTERLYTWNELASRAFNIYGNHTEKEIKRVNELIKKNGWGKITGNDAAIVSTVENYVKKNIGTSADNNDESAENIEMIIKNKISSHQGIVRLYGAIFRQLNVEHQFVLCGSRLTYAVDRSFENWNNCENVVIYFPKLKKYMAPTQLELRYPLIPHEWVGANGIFCISTTIGNFTTAIADVRRIQGEDYTWSSSNIIAEISLNATLDTLRIHSRQSFTGYSSIFYRASFNFSSDEQQRLLIKEMSKFGTNSERVMASKIENKEMEHFQENKPFVLDLVVNAGELVDRAGNKVLVKIGEIIGPQVEMYQEKQRQFDIDVNFPHVLARTIEFIIPEGYKVKNPDDLNISKVVRDNNQTTMGFESSYKLEGNILKVSITEQYCRLQYPLSQYEDFKRIINAAADFNKVILVLEPTG
jgi:hypothetical protein